MAERAKITVEYEDGSTESFNPNKPKFLLAMERKFGVSVPEKHEHIVWLAWHALGEPGDSLNKWVDTVEYIDDGSSSEGDASGEAPAQS